MADISQEKHQSPKSLKLDEEKQTPDKHSLKWVVLVAVISVTCLTLSVAALSLAISALAQRDLVSSLQQQILGLKSTLQIPSTSSEVKGKEGGGVYTRWGRTVCGDNSVVVYEGMAGGSEYRTMGGGVNYQCMPENPEFNRHYRNGNNTKPWVGSYMYASEYQSYNYGIFPDSAHDQNVPCARCYTNNRPAVMMIPAKRTCPDGWTREYEGYLMTMFVGHEHPTTFECVDANPSYIPGERDNTDGMIFYFTRATCNELPCPPYSSEKELTCVVCSR